MDKLNHIFSKVSKEDRKLGFSVPDNYFDQLPSRIQEAINSGSKPSIVFMPNHQVKYALSFIISIVIIISGYFIFTNYSYKNITSEDIFEYIQLIDDQYDDLSLIDLIDENSLNSYPDNEINEIIDYLVTDNIDYTAILEEYLK